MLSLEDWMYFGTSAALMAVGVLLMVVPARQLGLQRRPWIVVWSSLAGGLTGVLLLAARLWDLSPAAAPIILTLGSIASAASLGYSAWFFTRIWLNSRRSKMARPHAQSASTLAYTTEAPMPGPDVEREVRAILVDGRKIEAIRRVRLLTGMGLKEAKDYVESLKTSGGL
ncbi:MAG: ribosomal protein L7/L12 [Chloroflexota bacterium]|nr:ribosomal protein L7/L12 [Chloroflexota bacterium]